MFNLLVRDSLLKINRQGPKFVVVYGKKIWDEVSLLKKTDGNL